MKTTIGSVRALLVALRGAAVGLTAALAAAAGPLIGSGALIAMTAAPAPAAAQSSGWCSTFGGCYPTAFEAGASAVSAGTAGFGVLTNIAPSGTPGHMLAMYGAYWGQNHADIYYYCPGTLVEMPPGGCPSGPPVPTDCDCDGNSNQGGTPSPSTPHPIDILSGNKQLNVTDFTNVSGTLKLTRVHASAAQSSGTAWRAQTPVAPFANPAGLGNWLFDFQFELQIPSATPTSAVVLLAPNGSAPAFIQNSAESSSLTLVPYTTGTYPNPQTDFILSIVGYTPSGGSLTAGWPTSLTAQSTTWTLQAPDDTVYTLTTYLDPNTSLYDIARPTKIQWRDGHSWTLAYGAQGGGELDTVEDNFGNTASFTWQLLGNNAPLAINSVALGTASGGPSGYGLQYTYATAGGPIPYSIPFGASGYLNYPDLLTEVDYLAPSGGPVQDCTAGLDCTFYTYGQSTCPYNVTAVLDAGKTQRWGVVYDPNSCMATVSSVNGAAPLQTGAVRAYQVAYPSQPGAAGGTFTRVVTNPLGKVSTYTYLNNATEGLQLTEIQNAASTYSPASTRIYAYNAYGFVSKITDENGNVETVGERLCSYSGTLNFICGMPNKTVEASTSTTPRTTTTGWTAAGLPSLITAPTSTTAFGYTAFGGLATKTVTDETSFTTPYATNGRVRKWTWSWNSANQLSAIHGPLWVSGGNVDTTAFTYNTTGSSIGYLATITQYLNATTTAMTRVTSWDWRGAPLSVTDPNGVVTTFTYDIHGRLLTKTVNSGNAGGSPASVWQYAYDDVGDLTQLTLPVAGGTFSYTYDQGQRLITIADIRNEAKTFTYDNNDDPTSITITSGAGSKTYTHSGAYDEWGRLIQSIGAASQTWNLTYDNLSNLLTVTDPIVAPATSGNVRQTTWDPLNRPTVQTDPLLNTVTSGYDLADNLDQLTDANKLVTNREVDGFGETIQEVSPDRGTLQYWYDLHGNLIEKLDADSVETQNAYDWANRLVSTTYTLNVPANPTADPAETVTYTYDATAGGNYGIGRLTSVTDVSGSEAMTYDAQGRQIADAKVVKTGGYTAPFTTTYAYDANSQVIGIGYPSGDALSYTRTADGLVTAISFTPKGGTQPQTVATGVVHAPFGKVTTLTYGNGLGLTRTYNQDYELTEVETAPTTGSALLNESFGWQTDGRIASVTDNLTPAMGPTSRTAAYTYAATGRIATGSGPWGSLSWSFDPNGNLTGIGTATKMTLVPTSNQISTLAVSGTPTDTYSYLPGGELSQDANTASTWAYAYNAARRLTEVTMGGAESGAYAYDWAGVQVYQQAFGLNGAGTFQTAHLADLDGHVQADHNAATGGLDYEYIWLDGMLMGQVTSSGSTRSIYAETTGQNDEPQLLTSPAGAVEASTYLQPMGSQTNIGTATFTPQLRYPGQWVRTEGAPSHLYHNGQRDYAPNLGRYTQADPLGIDAGPNPYAYVDGDPLNAIDPGGMSTLVFNRGDGTISLYDRSGNLIITCDASNNPQDWHRHSESRPPYANGVYEYRGWSPKPVDPNGPYGSHGVFHFPRPGCPGCEVHAGRANKGGPHGTYTNGCIRTTDKCTATILDAVNAGDPPTTLTVQ